MRGEIFNEFLEFAAEMIGPTRPLPNDARR
jgi:hypothetical protein